MTLRTTPRPSWATCRWHGSEKLSRRTQVRTSFGARLLTRSPGKDCSAMAGSLSLSCSCPPELTRSLFAIVLQRVLRRTDGQIIPSLRTLPQKQHTNLSTPLRGTKGIGIRAGTWLSFVFCIFVVVVVFCCLLLLSFVVVAFVFFPYNDDRPPQKKPAWRADTQATRVRHRPTTEPRDNPSWNSSAGARADKHGNIATQVRWACRRFLFLFLFPFVISCQVLLARFEQVSSCYMCARAAVCFWQPLITEEAADIITGVFQNRWRTLMSVDDVISDVISLCEELGVANNTYFFYSSDHGFQV